MTTVNAEPDVKQWAEWALDNEVSPTITGFVRWRPELLMAKDIPGEGAFPSPRSWEAVSHILSLALPANIERELILRTVGEGATIEFHAYLRTSRELPHHSVHFVQSDEGSAAEVAAEDCYALVTMLGQHTREFHKSAMKYVNRMPKEFALLYITDIWRGDQYNIRKDADVGEWIGENRKLFETEVAA